MNIFNRKIGNPKRARVFNPAGHVPGLKGSVSRPGATGLPGEPSLTALQKFSSAFANRPESLVGYTGGWTFGMANRPSENPSAAYKRGNVGGIGG